MATFALGNRRSLDDWRSRNVRTGSYMASARATSSLRCHVGLPDGKSTLIPFSIRFRWAECQIYAVERLRVESQIRIALSNLPKDLTEAYIRMFEEIPEIDQPIIHRMLLWICGHSKAPWTVDRGDQHRRTDSGSRIRPIRDGIWFASLHI